MILICELAFSLCSIYTFRYRNTKRNIYYTCWMDDAGFAILLLFLLLFFWHQFFETAVCFQLHCQIEYQKLTMALHPWQLMVLFIIWFPFDSSFSLFSLLLKVNISQPMSIISIFVCMLCVTCNFPYSCHSFCTKNRISLRLLSSRCFCRFHQKKKERKNSCTHITTSYTHFKRSE